MTLKSDAKLVEKKYRDETGLFMVEGKKGILELLESDLTVLRVYVTPEESSAIKVACESYSKRRGSVVPTISVINEENLVRAGTLRSNTAGIAIAEQKIVPDHLTVLEAAQSEFILVLDTINDPGNLGTIIRTADWFGVSHIVVSPQTVDVYNPKVIRASMGSFTRVHVAEFDLISLLMTAHDMDIPTYGAVLHGVPLSDTVFGTNGIIVIGSESHGIESELQAYIKKPVTIERIGDAESLNVAVATGIILREITKV